MLNILYQMNRDQVKALSERTNLAFLPVSPCEAHGPHLPVSADVITAFTMAKDCARKLEDQGIESLIATQLHIVSLIYVNFLEPLPSVTKQWSTLLKMFV